MDFQKLLKVCTFLVALFPSLCFSQSSWSDSHLSILTQAKYDLEFKRSTSMYMHGVDWRILKAQCYQESLFDERAISPVGAKGICQFMPGTWREQIQRAGITDASPFNATLNIEIAARYMSQLRNQWNWERPEWDRHSLAMASYNAGLGNLLKAQRSCDNNSLYCDIIVCLPDITGIHSEETIGYVERIWMFYSRILEQERISDPMNHRLKTQWLLSD